MSTFTADEKSNLLFKKLMGKPSTLDTREFFQEPSRSARAAVFQNQVYATSIPNVAASDLQALTETSNDMNGDKMEGSYAGKKSGVVTRYIKIQLTMLPGTNGASWEAHNISNAGSHPNGYADGSTSSDNGTVGNYGRVLQDAVPFNYDAVTSTYNVKIYRDNGGRAGAEIAFGDSGGHWVLDNESGIVTFYQYSNVSSFVDSSKPIYISFYRYTGNKGAVQTNDGGVFTFANGDGNAVDDSLSTIIVDPNANLASKSDTSFCQAIQFGTSSIGSWRICVQGGGNSNETQLVFQYRNSDSNNGTWKTISGLVGI